MPFLVRYNDSFCLFLTTKRPNPHYAPEICVSVAMLNFVTTFDGLLDQMLSVLVAAEQPATEQKRQELVVESSASRSQLKSLEDRILAMLSDSKGSLLDDEELIDALAGAQTAYQRIEERIEAQERVSHEIADIRRQYEGVASRSSALFFAVQDMAVVEAMYQYSLEWFVGIFERAVEKAPKGRGNKRMTSLNEEFLKQLHANVCRSLFQKDLLLFIFRVTVQLLKHDGDVKQDQLDLFLCGGRTSGSLERKRPAVSWLTEVMWARVLELEKLGGIFEGLSQGVEADLDGWQAVVVCDTPTEADWPNELNNRATSLEKGLVMFAFRPDAVVHAIRGMVASKIGQAFLTPPGFSCEACYIDSKPHVPLIFVLSVGADPMAEVYRLAAAREMEDLVTPISLGQGQGPRATAAIQSAMTTGEWVVLMNCHLGASYMPQLEVIVDGFETNRSLHSNFRLWLTSLPSATFPVTVLQNGIKMTYEPPQGLKSNLVRAYQSYDEDLVEKAAKPREMKKLLFGLSFFHALVISRRKFGPLGWNRPYQFSESDRAISARQLRDFVDDHATIQFDALNYLAAECNYGGRVTDSQDRRLIVTIMREFYCPEIIEEGYCFNDDPVYMVPADCSKAGVTAYIETLPIDEPPSVFGLNSNAELTANLNEGTAILRMVSALTSNESQSAGGRKTEEKVAELALSILEQIPRKELFDVAAVRRQYPTTYHESMNTVLVQELWRFNRLLQRILGHLRDIPLASKGLVVMTPEVEQVCSSFLDNRVPDSWRAVSYSSLKPLASGAEMHHLNASRVSHDNQMNLFRLLSHRHNESIWICMYPAGVLKLYPFSARNICR